MFQLIDNLPSGARIKVVGVGGGGGNAVAYMFDTVVEGVEFLCANTDAQALRKLDTHATLHIGSELTKGLGAGANPEVGRGAAIENRDQIRDALRGADLVFITAGMGGGTGTGAAPIIAEVARELGALTVAVVTKPFKFEGKKRMKIAEQGIAELRDSVDSLIIIPNEKLLPVLGKNCSLIKAFDAANDVLRSAVQGIADLITRPGMMNVDFADVRTVMSEMGMAMMGSGSASGENRARIATEQALASPLLEDVDLNGARGILVNITASEDLNLGEFNDVGELIAEYASDEATIVIGTALDPLLNDEVKVSVVVTGLDPYVKAVVEPTLIETQARYTPEFDIKKVQLPEILRPRRFEALLDKREPEASLEDLKYLDIPAYTRR